MLHSELTVALARARKKAIAHYDMVATKDGPKLHRLADIGLKWGDAKVFLNELDPIVWDLALLATWGSYAKDEFERIARLYAADFWARLRGKPPVDDVD